MWYEIRLNATYPLFYHRESVYFLNSCAKWGKRKVLNQLSDIQNRSLCKGKLSHPPSQEIHIASAPDGSWGGESEISFGNGVCYI